MIEFGSRVRLDYQPLFGKMSPHSSPPAPPSLFGEDQRLYPRLEEMATKKGHAKKRHKERGSVCPRGP